MKIVGVDFGAQAAKVKVKVNKTEAAIKPGKRRVVFMSPIIMQGRHIVALANLILVFCRGRSAIIAFAAHVERKRNFTAERLLANDRVDLIHQFGILADVFFGILTALT